MEEIKAEMEEMNDLLKRLGLRNWQPNELSKEELSLATRLTVFLLSTIFLNYLYLPFLKPITVFFVIPVPFTLNQFIPIFIKLDPGIKYQIHPFSGNDHAIQWIIYFNTEILIDVIQYYIAYALAKRFLGAPFSFIFAVFVSFAWLDLLFFWLYDQQEPKGIRVIASCICIVLVVWLSDVKVKDEPT